MVPTKHVQQHYALAAHPLQQMGDRPSPATTARRRHTHRLLGGPAYISLRRTLWWSLIWPNNSSKVALPALVMGAGGRTYLQEKERAMEWILRALTSDPEDE
jgi:hypothetical protein